MPRRFSLSPSLIVAVVISFLGGGLAGAVFNWYMNRPDPAIITYGVTTASLPAAEATSLVPNLKIQIRDEPIRALYIHTVEFTHRQGPHVDRVDVAVTFAPGVRVYGIASEAPSAVHSIGCTEIKDGTRCTISPMTPRDPRGYRVVLATDEGGTPNVTMVAKGTELFRIEDFLLRQRWSPSWMLAGKTVSVILLLAVYIFFGYYTLRAMRRILRRSSRPIIVGKVLAADGKPLPGARVEVALVSPRPISEEAFTDSSGDFIIGSLAKMASLAGRVRITHSNYTPVEDEITSPIVIKTLQQTSQQLSSTPSETGRTPG